MQHILTATTVVFKLETILRLHSIALAIDIFGIKIGRRKKLRKTIQSRLEVRGIYIEKIVGVLEASAGVMAAAVLANKALILAWLGIFFGAQKQHMLKKMHQTGAVLGILITAHIDI